MSSLTPGILQCERLAEVLLRLEITLHKLKMKRMQKAGGLPQDHNKLGGRLDRRNGAGGVTRAQIEDRGLSDALPWLRRLK